MKKIFGKLTGILLSVLMTVVMIPILPASAESKSFQDVSSNDWFYDSVQYVSNNGLMNGMTDQTFEPQTTMSRAMAVTILYRLEGEPSAVISGFQDVPTDTWFTDSVAWASEDGIVNGYNQDTFGPYDEITREQMAAILFRYADRKGYDVSPRADLSIYNDSEDVSEWAVEALAWSIDVNLIVGFEDHTLLPGANTTRAQASAIFMRFCEGVAKDNPSEDPGKTEEKSFTVTFDYNYSNQGVFRTVDVKDGETAGMIDQPSRRGYLFSGWYTEAENGENVDIDKTTIHSDLTLYAHWTLQRSNGSGHSSGGGSVLSPEETLDAAYRQFLQDISESYKLTVERTFTGLPFHY